MGDSLLLYMETKATKERIYHTGKLALLRFVGSAYCLTSLVFSQSKNCAHTPRNTQPPPNGSATDGFSIVLGGKL